MNGDMQKEKMDRNGRISSSRFTQRRRYSKRRWLVVISSFYCIACSAGFYPTISVLFVEFQDEFKSTKAEISLVQSVCSAMVFCAGVISGQLVMKFGERKCTMVGAIMSGTGLGISYFANGIPFLVGSMGILSGTGFSLCLVSSFSIAPKYFTGRRRLFIIGFVTTGAGVGAFMFPIAMQFLLRTYGWRGVALIFSGINLNMLIPAMLFKHNKQSKNEHSASLGPSCATTLRDVLTNGAFLGYCVSVWILYPCFNTFLIFFIDLFEFNGFSRSTGAWLLTGTNVANTLSRLIPPFLSQIEKIPKLSILAITLPITATVFVLFPFAKTIVHYVILVGIFGICLGVKRASLSLTVFHIVGAERYPIALGILMTGYGSSNAIAGPIGGYIRDVTGSYDFVFYISAGALSLSFIILLVTLLTCIIRDQSTVKPFRTIEVEEANKNSQTKEMIVTVIDTPL